MITICHFDHIGYLYMVSLKSLDMLCRVVSWGETIIFDNMNMGLMSIHFCLYKMSACRQCWKENYLIDFYQIWKIHINRCSRKTFEHFKNLLIFV